MAFYIGISSLQVINQHVNKRSRHHIRPTLKLTLLFLHVEKELPLVLCTVLNFTLMNGYNSTLTLPLVKEPKIKATIED